MNLKRGLTGKALFVPVLFNELFITGQEKLLCVFFCKIIMASWSEEKSEGSLRCWVGGGGGTEVGFAQKWIVFLLHWDLSNLAVSKQLHYGKKEHTTIWWNTISMFKQGQESFRCGSQCSKSPQGWSHWDEKETVVFHNGAACPVGTRKRATFNMVVNFRLVFYLNWRDREAKRGWFQPARSHTTGCPRMNNIQVNITSRHIHILRLHWNVYHSYVWPCLHLG